MRYERRERVLGDQLLQDFSVGLVEVMRYVHSGSRDTDLGRNARGRRSENDEELAFSIRGGDEDAEHEHRRTG